MIIKPEIIESWNRNIKHTTIPFSLEKNGKMTIPDDWDSLLGKYDTKHIFVMFEHTGSETAIKMARWADDNIIGLFTYRDWTLSNLPFVDENEIYWTGFTFQKLEDAKVFVENFGGSGNWMEGHDEFVEHCNKKRK